MHIAYMYRIFAGGTI